MKINGNQVRKGTLLLFEGGLWRVTKAEATKTGKSGAYNQVEMKNIQTGTKKNTRFRASENVERARLDEKACTYLYAEDDNIIVMDSETYDQIMVPFSVIGDDSVFLADGMEVTIESYEGTPVNLMLPSQVTLTVDETEPVVKGQTATSSYKPATLSNGVRIGVPQFINGGDEIIVDTTTREYVNRA